MTAVPQQVVAARRIAGALLVLSVFGTIITLVIAIGWWSTLPRTVTATSVSTLNPPAPRAAPVASPVPVPAAPVPLSAQVALQQQVDRDQPYVERLIGSWVPQLSSKTVGLRVNGTTYGPDEILADFTSLKARYPQALLLRSDDYPVFTTPGYWVTVASFPYSTGTEANYWCDSQGIDTDNCFAKLLQSTGGPAGTTMSRK